MYKMKAVTNYNDCKHLILISRLPDLNLQLYAPESRFIVNRELPKKPSYYLPYVTGEVRIFYYLGEYNLETLENYLMI